MINITNDQLANLKNFGIEIECFNVNREFLVRKLTDEGINVEGQSYNHRTATCWKIVNDSTIRGINPNELVSPILNGVSGLKQIETVCRVLNECGAKVNKSCGLHVHHEAIDNITKKQMENILTFWVKNEKTFDSLVSKSRRADNSPFCRSPKENLERMTEPERDATDTSRYCKVNLQSFYRHGTIEFRQHQGTLNATKMIAWVLLTAQVNQVAPTVKAKSLDPMRPIYMKRKLNLVRTDLWNFLKSRSLALA